MAVVWQRTTGGRHYEVRRAGASLRLYTNGAFHSQYNPNHLFSGAVWDLLALPALFARRAPRTVLMLGVGGGAAIHQLNTLLAPNAIVGIELDPVHVDIAQRLFHVRQDNVTLITADAIDWIKHSRRHFDLVVDDLFLDASGDPERPQPVDLAWLRALASRTTREGIVVQNHLSTVLAQNLVTSFDADLKQLFRSALLFTTAKYENGVLALFRQHATSHQRQAVIDSLDRNSARRLRFDCIDLF